MELQDVIHRRRSIRAYRRDPVPGPVERRLREALQAAPSANNAQPCTFVFVSDPEVRARLVREACHQPGFGDAPLIVVACCPGGSEFDAAIAVDHLVLAAANEGLGSCWVGWIERDVIRSLLGIPAGIEVPVIVPIGYAAETPAPQTRKALGEIIRDETWRRA